MNKKPKNHRPLTTEEAVFIENLLTENKQRIKNVVYRELGEAYRSLVEDAIHDVYLLMCQKIDTLKEHSCPKAWIIVASKYVAQGMIAKNKKYMYTVPIDTVTEQTSEADISEEAVYKIWLENKVPEKLIEELTKREREIYCKLYIERKTPKEAAAELNLTTNAVYNFNKNLKDKIKNAIKRKKFQIFY